MSDSCRTDDGNSGTAGLPDSHVRPLCPVFDDSECVVLDGRLRIVVPRSGTDENTLSQQVSELESEVQELEREITALERTADYREKQKQQLIDRYENILSRYRRRYRKLTDETTNSRLGRLRSITSSFLK